MDTRKQIIESLISYWWVPVLVILLGVYLTDWPILRYALFIIGIPFALMLFLPFIIYLFSPALALISTLIDHFSETERMPFSKKYIFLPAAIIGAASYSFSQIFYGLWMFLIAFLVWDRTIGTFVTIALWLFGLSPLIVLTAPLFVWYQAGFMAFLTMGLSYVFVILWFSFSSLVFSEDHRNTVDDYLGYSPQLYLLSALSMQIIAYFCFQFKIYNLGIWIADLGGGVFLLLALIAKIQWNFLKKGLSKEEQERVYKAPIWVYILGFIYTNMLYLIFKSLFVPTASIFWLNLFFLLAIIGRAFGFVYDKVKNRQTRAI